jgi:metal-responsive CopG/Arc/MetJ family transcriptional regulator
MAQLTIYMPDDLASQVKRAAEKAGKSVSKFLAEMARSRLRPSRWPRSFVELSGRGLEGFPEIEDPVPDEVEGL